MFETSHLHPMIVHFPIALLIVGFLFDAISLFTKKEFFTTAGLYLIILGTLGAAAAFFTGLNAGSGISETGSLKQALETHAGAAELALWIMAIAAVVRIILVIVKKYAGGFKYAALFLSLIGVLAIARTGYYGGELVFRHAAGVEFNLGFDSGTEGSGK